MCQSGPWRSDMLIKVNMFKTSEKVRMESVKNAFLELHHKFKIHNRFYQRLF